MHDREFRVVVAMLALLCAAGCGGREPVSDSAAPRDRTAGVRVFADSAASVRLAVRPPVTAVRLAEAEPAQGAAPLPPLPSAAPDSAIPSSEGAAATAADDALHPPIPRAAGSLTVPPGIQHSEYVELELRVDERGSVSEFRWVGGSRDTAFVRAARDAAATLSFYPALLRGQPVAVWCHQRFDFTPR